jgi:hypothetical protein
MKEGFDFVPVSKFQSNLRPAKRPKYSGLMSSGAMFKGVVAGNRPEQLVSMSFNAISREQLPDLRNIFEHHFRDILVKSMYLQRDCVASAT